MLMGITIVKKFLLVEDNNNQINGGNIKYIAGKFFN